MKVVAAAIAAAAQQCTQHASLQCYGQDIRDYGVVGDAQACCAACVSTSGCTWWTFNSGIDQHCWLKTGCQQISGDSRYVSGTSAAPPAPPTPAPAGPEVAWVKYAGDNCYTGHGGEDLEDPPGSTAGIVTIEDCEKLCLQLADCAGIVVTKDSPGMTKHQCYRRGNVVPSECDHSSPFDLYVRTGATPAPPNPPPPSPPTPQPSRPSGACPGFEAYNPPAGAPPLQKGQGGGCSCATEGCQGVTPSFNWIFTACTDRHQCPKANDDSCACSAGNGDPTHITLNYATAYQLTKTGSSWSWVRSEASSLNLDGGGTAQTALVLDQATGRNDFEKLSNETAKTPGVVNSISGGGGGWDASIFPYDTPGLQPPGMLFVFSGRLRGAAWFMLNKATLDRGPQDPTCNTDHNCWSAGSDGELDFLESPNLFGSQKRMDTNSHSKLWATSYNAAGRCFNQNTLAGSYCPDDGFCMTNPVLSTTSGSAKAYSPRFAQGSGGPYSLWSYSEDDGKEHLWAAVVDFRGVHMYRDPHIAGLTKTSAPATITQLAPDLSSPMTAGACGDPKVYSAAQLKYQCVVHLPSAPLYMTQAQFDAATQLVTSRPSGWQGLRYPATSVSIVANAWDTGAKQCDSELWWNLFIDTVQPVAPTAMHGVAYTADVITEPVHSLVVPGVNRGPSTSSAQGWIGVIADGAGQTQASTRGSLKTSCMPQTTSSFSNCPYAGQANWYPAMTRSTPNGVNRDLCGGGGGCCDGSCSSALYRSILAGGVCPVPCQLSQVPSAVPSQGHGGCAVTQPACPATGATASCGPSPPFNAGIKCAVTGCSACTLVSGPDNFAIVQNMTSQLILPYNPSYMRVRVGR